VRDLTLRTPTLDDVFLELTGTRIDITATADVTNAGITRTEEDRP
jgi:hypothetical protein